MMWSWEWFFIGFCVGSYVVIIWVLVSKVFPVIASLKIIEMRLSCLESRLFAKSQMASFDDLLGESLAGISKSTLHSEEKSS